MKKFAVIVFLAFTISGCKTNMIAVESIEPLVNIISERHDAYINADENLSEDKKDTFLRSTELLRAVMTEAKK